MPRPVLGSRESKYQKQKRLYMSGIKTWPDRVDLPLPAHVYASTLGRFWWRAQGLPTHMRVTTRRIFVSQVHDT